MTDDERKTFLKELVNSAAVKASARELSGATDEGAVSKWHLASGLLSSYGEETTHEIRARSTARAIEIFQTGQDWQRELKLYETLTRYFDA